jgi:hypothetical protein
LVLGCDVSILIEVAGLVAVFPVEIGWDGNAACSHQDAHEGEATFAGVEAVNFFEDDWERLKKDVEDAID